MISERKYLWITLGISLALLSVNLLIPLSIDNDIYQSMGWELVKHGGLPYLGSWDHNFPGVVYFHAIGILLFGSSDTGFRLLDILTHLGTIYLLFRIVATFFHPRAAISAAILYAVNYVSGTYWIAGQRDSFAALFLAWATWLLLSSTFRERSRSSLTSYFFIAGLFFSFAGAIRPTYGLFGVLAVGYIILTYKLTRSLPHLAALIAGAVTTWILILLPYVFIQDGLNQFYQATIRFNIDVYGAARKVFSFRGAAKYLLFEPLFLLGVAGLLPIQKGSITKRDTATKLYFIGSLLAAWASVYVMGKFFSYHFEPLIAIASGFAGVGLWKLSSLFPKKVGAVVLPLALAVLIVLVYPWALPSHFLHAVEQGSAHPMHDVRLAMKADSLFGLAAEEEVCKYLNVPQNRQGKIELASVTPGIRWRSRREEATRFTMVHALAMHQKGHALTSFQVQCQKEYIEQLNRVKPTFIVLANGPTYLEMFSDESPAALIHEVPGFDSLLQQQYSLDTTIRGFTIYRLHGTSTK